MDKGNRRDDSPPLRPSRAENAVQLAGAVIFVLGVFGEWWGTAAAGLVLFAAAVLRCYRRLSRLPTDKDD
ncbi:MAG: hypothetical protein QM656_09390 [Paracoccaceae bacterium]